MKTKKKRIAQEIQSRILTIVIAIFMVVAVVVAVMVGNVSLSAQKNDLEMQSKAASYQLEIFFQEYMTIVEQMALDKDVRTLLTETKAGDKITESADYQTVFHEMEKIAAADSDNIQAVWLGDIDANVATQSDGFTSDSSFEITERTWYRAVETNSTILTSAYVEASTGNLILSAAAPVYDENGKNIIGVAGADIALEHIDELLSAYKIGNNGFVILVTSDGTIIYHPNSDNQLKNLSELNVSDSVMKAIQSQNGTSVKYKADGSSKYGYVGRIGTTDYYTYGADYGLYRQVNGGWYQMNKEMDTIAMAYELAPGESRKLTLSWGELDWGGVLPAGTYCVAQGGLLGEQQVTVSVTFAIK